MSGFSYNKNEFSWRHLFLKIKTVGHQHPSESFIYLSLLYNYTFTLFLLSDDLNTSF